MIRLKMRWAKRSQQPKHHLTERRLTMSKRKANEYAYLIAPKEVRMIPMEDINMTEAYCFRRHLDAAISDQYAEIYKEHLDNHAADKNMSLCPFAPIHVLEEMDEYTCIGIDKYIVVEGRYRFQAAQKAGMSIMPCFVLRDRDEALRVGLGSNRHGQPLTHEDRVLCVGIAIRTLGISNRMIAELIGCGSRTVDKIVKEHQLRTDAQLVEGKDGKMRCASKNHSKSDQQQNDMESDCHDAGVNVNGDVEIDSSDSGSSKNDTEGLLKAVKDSSVSSSPIVYIIDEMRAALELPQEDERRAKALVYLIKEILSDGFTKDQYRLEFLRMLKSEIDRWGILQLLISEDAM
jgi:hypothetical protein